MQKISAFICTAAVGLPALAAKALDAARHAGGNCVRIFKPRSSQSDAA